jgi:hypothetical protein
MFALKIIDHSKVLKLLGTNDQHHDTICRAQHLDFMEDLKLLGTNNRHHETMYL